MWGPYLHSFLPNTLVRCCAPLFGSLPANREFISFTVNCKNSGAVFFPSRPISVSGRRVVKRREPISGASGRTFASLSKLTERGRGLAWQALLRTFNSLHDSAGQSTVASVQQKTLYSCHSAPVAKELHYFLTVINDLQHRFIPFLFLFNDSQCCNGCRHVTEYAIVWLPNLLPRGKKHHTAVW